MDLIKSIAMGFVRHGLTGFAGYLLAHGLVTQSDQQVLISSALGLAGVAWSVGQKMIANYELQRLKGAPITLRSSPMAAVTTIPPVRPAGPPQNEGKS
jgi:hypothetical protein